LLVVKLFKNFPRPRHIRYFRIFWRKSFKKYIRIFIYIIFFNKFKHTFARIL
jgi:hypothetical protein